MEHKTFGRYKIINKLGAGGMASVYKAHDPRFGRDIALKIMPQSLLHDPTFRGRFDREARTIASLEHSSIVPVFDFGEEKGQPYLVMQLMGGGSLADHLRRGALTVSEATRIFHRIAGGLDEAHSKGIVHRDLKPANILFDRFGEAYLADFGIVKVQESTAALTGNNFIGTPAYMSPEQVQGDATIDGRSDIYALGTILYEMLTAEIPYQANTPVGIILKHVQAPVPNILETRPDLPQMIDEIIRKAMAKNKEDRYGSVAEMANALVAVVREQPTAVAPVPPKAKPNVATETADVEKEKAGDPGRDIFAFISLLVGFSGACTWIFPYCGTPIAIIGLILGYLGLSSNQRTVALIGLAINVIVFIATLALNILTIFSIASSA